MRKKRLKPRGRLGAIVIGSAPRGAGYQPLDLPATKEEIEEYVLAGAIAACAAKGATLYHLVASPERTRESDFDFTLRTKRGIEYLELTEVAPLQRTGKSYDRAPKSYSQGAMADLIFEHLVAKAEKYGGAPRTRVHLLAYVTDWRFVVSRGVLALVAWRWHKEVRGFSSLAYFVPETGQNGELTLLHPLPPASFDRFNASALRNRDILRPDPQELEIRPDGSGVLRLKWPPWRGV